MQFDETMPIGDISAFAPEGQEISPDVLKLTNKFLAPLDG